MELLEGQCYKCHMVGIPLEGSANVFRDNQLVVPNSSAPESTQKKKYILICFRVVCEKCDSAALCTTKVIGEYNLMDNSVPGPRLIVLVGDILFQLEKTKV